MQDLFYLLKEQIKYIPINKNKYFYDKDNKTFYNETFKKLKEDDKNIYLYLKNNKYKKISKYRLFCYFENGLLNNMTSILDNGYRVIKNSDNSYKWVNNSEFQMRNNINKLKQVFKDHPDLYIKDGFYDEGIIPYKYRKGFYIVPLTNGTFAINPITQEAVYTYSDKFLIPQFHERGDRKFSLNPRLTDGKQTIISSRAIAFISLPIPDKYKEQNSNIKEIINQLDVDHIDGNPSNNSISNLQYLTRQENLIKKLNQEQDPRVFPSTWLNPKGEKVRFRSYRQASIVINCNLAAIEKIYKGWRKNNNEINGWKLIEGKIQHPLENVYIELENLELDRSQLTIFKKEYTVYNINDKKFYLFNSIEDLCKKFNIYVSGLETHISIKGPLTPYKNLIVFPKRYINKLLKIKFFDKFIN